MTTPSRLLFGVLRPGLGGHTRTAVAVAGALRARGHHIDFLVAHGRAAAGTGTSSPDEVRTRGETDALIRASGFPVVPITDPYAVSRRSFSAVLEGRVRAARYDALHWFELHAGVRAAATVARRLGAAFVWTVTSGGVPDSYFGINRLVAFTPEIAADVRARSPRTDVHLLPARIDLDALAEHRDERARTSIRDRLGVGASDLLIVRVARCTPVYLRSIRAGLELRASLERAGRRATFVHVGYAQDEAVAAEIRRLVARANRGAPALLALSITDDVDRAVRYAAAADICIASGRSAIEALALERPTLVVWGSRYLGMVDTGNIAAMAAANFQGRHTPRIDSDARLVEEMQAAVRRRLASPSATTTHAHCAAFVREHYGVQAAAEAYERLYGDRRVTIAGPLAALADRRQLAREVFERLPSAITGSRWMRALRRARARRSPVGSED